MTIEITKIYTAVAKHLEAYSKQAAKIILLLEPEASTIKRKGKKAAEPFEVQGLYHILNPMVEGRQLRYLLAGVQDNLVQPVMAFHLYELHTVILGVNNVLAHNPAAMQTAQFRTALEVIITGSQLLALMARHAGKVLGIKNAMPVIMASMGSVIKEAGLTQPMVDTISKKIKAEVEKYQRDARSLVQDCIAVSANAQALQTALGTKLPYNPLPLFVTYDGQFKGKTINTVWLPDSVALPIIEKAQAAGAALQNA